MTQWSPSVSLVQTIQVEFDAPYTNEGNRPHTRNHFYRETSTLNFLAAYSLSDYKIDESLNILKKYPSLKILLVKICD